MLEDLKIAIEENKVILGSKRTLKYLKLGKVKMIVIANNCPDNFKKDLEHYTKLTGLKIENFDGTAKQLGIVCGKPFSVATLAILSETK
ncbi:MAG: 50S ribosomal protein L30e [Candidatus Aenigmarchaeota archaeon]|nr:50S ribosomal protein L30e [Candidatus Aenigmarchaeota archaeon]